MVSYYPYFLIRKAKRMLYVQYFKVIYYYVLSSDELSDYLLNIDVRML